MKHLLTTLILLAFGLALAHDCPPADRDLANVQPVMAERFAAWLHAAEHQGYRLGVSEGRRSQERQDCEYAHGNSWVHHSNHEDGAAVDIYLIADDGSAIWDISAYRQLYAEVPPQGFGLVDGGCLWGTDYDHLQLVEIQGQECVQ